MGGKNRTNTLRAADAAERASEALALLRQGLNNTAIAKRMGVNINTVTKWLDKAVQNIPAEEAAMRRELWGARLETAYDRVSWLWSKAEAHVDAADDGAVGDAARVISEQVKVVDRAAKFYGLDAPAKAEITGKDGAPLEMNARDALNERIASLVAGQAAGVVPAPVSSEPDDSGS